MMGRYRTDWKKTTRWLSAMALSACLGMAGSVKAADQTEARAGRLPEAAAAQLRAEADRDFSQQNFSDALEKYLRVYENYAGDFEINRRLGWIYANGPQADWRRGIPYLRKAHQLQPTNVDVLRDLASVTSWARNFGEAVPLYRELVRLSPSVPGYRRQFARVLAWAGQDAEAVREYRAYLTQAPSDLAARVELGTLLARQKDYPGASEQFNYTLRFQPRNGEARLGLAQVAAWSGELRPALAQVNEIVAEQPRHFDARVLKAYIHLWLRELDESKTLFTALAKESPANADVQQGLRTIAELQAPGAAPAAPGVPPRPTQPVEPTALQLAEQAEAETRYAEAIGHYREYLAGSPDDDDARFRLARVLGWHKQFAESEDILRQFVKKYPENPEGIVQLARVLRWDEKYEEAAGVYRQGLSVRPRDAALHLELAQVYSYMSDYPRSLDEYRTARSLDSESLEAKKGVVRALIWNGETGPAGKELAELQRTHADDPEVAALQQQLELFELQRARVESPARVEAYLREQVDRDPRDATARIELADLYIGRGEFPAGIKELRTAMELKPDQEDLRLKLGRVLSWNREYPESVGMYRGWLASYPEDQNVRLELARVLSWNKNYDAAVAEYEVILKQDPENTAARLEMARVLSWAKQYGPALENYDQVLQQDPKNYDALLGKGRVYSYQSRWSESIKAYGAALSVKPLEPEATRDRAQALLWSGDPAAARPILTKLHAENPTDTAVLISLASAENALARPDRALNLLEEAERLEPTNAEARTLRNQIRAALRPELRLGWSYLRDSEALNIWAYRVDFSFNPHPRLRTYLKVDYLPSSGLAALFGYPVFGEPETVFAPNVPLDGFIPSPSLLSETDFPDGFLVPGGTRISQSAGQFQAGGTMRVNRWFSWTGGAGAITLRHGGPDLDAAGLPSTRTRFIYNASPTFHLGRHVLISLGSSRQYWAYTPKSTAQEVHVDELSGSLVLMPNSRSRIALGYYHRQISPPFLIPDIFVFDPELLPEPGPVLTFEGRSFKKIGNGGTFTATGIVFRGEKAEIEVGYDAMAFGYNHPPGLTAPEFFLNTGIFTPSFYQRHAGMFRIGLTPSRYLYWDLHGSAGVQQIRQAPDLSFSSTAGSRLDFNFSDNVTLSLGYDYFNAASAVQAVIVAAPAGAYHSNQITAGLRFRF
ncbi:MAG: tetratricopeptide repeat protein [Acidobacteria bacterium]|nr:tetratricopeptide repeat protein [Acidobacteriota bacterium]